AMVGAVMLVAAVSAHIRKGFFAHNGGYEYTLVLGATAVALAFTGPGNFALDQALGISWSGEAWGLAALAAGLVGGVVPLLARKTAPTSSSEQAA
ncbi:MAG TPA: DoxX family protein, partial [Vicinamibacteria bacterium]|nr:DoxX family protein [Vicinamibacteria bacterium]